MYTNNGMHKSQMCWALRMRRLIKPLFLFEGDIDVERCLSQPLGQEIAEVLVRVDFDILIFA